MSQTRINKFLSEHGYCSRREADRLIEQGRVRVNGRLAKLGDKITDSDEINVEGRSKTKQQEHVYVIFNKPIGSIASKRRRAGIDIDDGQDLPKNIFQAGSMVPNSAGLMILTNDNVLAHKLSNPRFNLEEEYVVDLQDSLDSLDIGKIKSMFVSQFGQIKIRQMSEYRFAIALRQNIGQHIQRICETLRHEIIKLTRTRIGPIKISISYPAGSWRYLTRKEVDALKKSVGLDKRY